MRRAALRSLQPRSPTKPPRPRLCQLTSHHVVAVHLDLHEGVLSFSKNGVACKHATFTELRGKTLRPVLCMDNAGWVASALC